MSKLTKETAVAEIRRLTAELAEIRKRLTTAANVEPRGDIAKDARLTPYLADAQIVLDIINRIKELRGRHDNGDFCQQSIGQRDA